MAILVEHITTHINYILIGTGYSHYKDTTTSGYGAGGWQPHHIEEGIDQMVAVSDAKGTLHWLPSKEIRVISIDGTPIEGLLTDNTGQIPQTEPCPGCGYPVSTTTAICPSCELTLIFEEEAHVL